jgi:hypothetical protein
MAIDEGKSLLVENNRLSRQSKLANAQQALEKHRLGQSRLTDKDWGDKI